MNELRVVFLGDVVGRPGRRAIAAGVPVLRDKYEPDLIIINAENAASGSGINEKSVRELFQVNGVNILTLGDHAFKRNGTAKLLQSNPNIVRPLNLSSAPGKGFTKITTINGANVAVINLIGRVFMNPAECPFNAVDEVIDELTNEGIKLIIIDFHAEATSEKIAMGFHLDGKVTALLGTHTHIQTADEKILSDGTAYITDVGMCGPQKSVLGRAIDDVLKKFITGIHVQLTVAEEENELHGVFITADIENGKAKKIERIKMPVKIF